jgi:hypothetical protein
MSTKVIIIVGILLLLGYLYATGAFTPKVYGPVTWGPKHGYRGHTGATKKLTCPNGSYINLLHGKYDQHLISLGATCSDGTTLPISGGTSGKDFSVNSPSGGWGSIQGSAGWWNDRLLGFGGVTGTPYNDTCPADQYITGVEVNSDGTLVGGLQFGCNTV